MAHSVKRVNVQGVRQESMLYWAWRAINGLIDNLDGHNHGSVTAGGSNTGNKILSGQRTIANLEGRNVDTGLTQAGLPAAGGGALGVRTTAAPDSLLAELIDTFNNLAVEIDGHVHGGVSGTANTSGVASGDPTKLFQITDLDGTDPAVGTALTPSVVAANLKAVRRGRGFAGDLAQLVSSINAAVATMKDHTHTATTGAASTSVFNFTSAVAKVADLNGKGPDGETVT